MTAPADYEALAETYDALDRMWNDPIDAGDVWQVIGDNNAGLFRETAAALRQAAIREQRVREWAAKQSGPLHIREACAQEVLATLDTDKGKS